MSFKNTDHWDFDLASGVLKLPVYGRIKLADASWPLMNQLSCHFRDFESKTNHLGDTDGTPVKTRRHSWRQQIFLRVATPQKACDSPSRYEGKAIPRSN